MVKEVVHGGIDRVPGHALAHVPALLVHAHH
jgi:hypothetical protein